MADGAPTFSVVWMLLPLPGCEKVDLAADACLLEESADDPCGTYDCNTERTFQLAGTGVQMRPNVDDSPFFGIGTECMADDLDVVAIHEDFMGIPWEEFADGEEPPEAWEDAIDVLVASTGDAPVYLALQLLGGDNRAWLGSQVVINDQGRLGDSESEWSDECFDFSGEEGDTYRDAFIDYALWMVDRFDPDWLNIAIEMNLYFEACPEPWSALVEAEAAIYAAVKEEHPDLPVFPSFVIESLYGLDPDCTDTAEACLAETADTYEERYAALDGIARDRFAISVYPFGFESMTTVADIPSDFFSGPADRGGESLLIAETGWNSAPVVAEDNACDECVTWRENGCGEQTAYLDRIVKEADEHDIDLVTWWSHRDLLPSGISSTCNYQGLPWVWRVSMRLFQESFGCYLGDIVFKLWGTMGIRNYDGDPKEVYARWYAARKRPLMGESDTD